MNLILPHLWLGDREDAQANVRAALIVIDVRWPGEMEYGEGGWAQRLTIPTTRILTSPDGTSRVEVIPRAMDIVADLVHYLRYEACDVLVHCTYGMERSPLTVMWYLVKHNGMNWYEAREHVEKWHPQTIFHGEWLPENVREELRRAMVNRPLGS